MGCNDECNGAVCIRAHRNTAQLRHGDGLRITEDGGSCGVGFDPAEMSQLCFIT